MRVFARVLQEIADRCLQHSNQSRHVPTSRFMRLLAVDLMLAAEQHRNTDPRSIYDQVVELRRQAAERQPMAAAAPTPENASTA
jgi:hypothetical protein